MSSVSADKLKIWKRANMPADGVCPECKTFRGLEPRQWTLLPNHMYCKYCFIRNVADKDEQSRLRDSFLAAFKAGEVTMELTDSMMIREILDIVRMLVPQQAALLNDQFIGVAETAREHLKQRMQIRTAPTKIGRYLIGPELEGIWGDRIYELIEGAPLSLMRGPKAVLTTQACLAAHRELSANPPTWLLKAMRVYTVDPTEFLDYPAAYFQALARGL